MPETGNFVFEEQNEVEPVVGSLDTFTNSMPKWSFPHNNVVPGAIILTQATRAAYKTVSTEFHVHSLQTQLLVHATMEEALWYGVHRIATTHRIASRLVLVKQEGQTKVSVTVNFMRGSDEDMTMQRFSHAPEASLESIQAAAVPIDNALDEYARSNFPNWPDNIPYPAISAQRLSVSGDDGIEDRVYRSKLRTTCPLSYPEAQILAIIYLSDHYVLDAPLTVQGLSYGMHRIGDTAKKPVRPDVRMLATLNYSMHFYRTTGFDVQQGVLFEVQSRWANGHRAVAQLTVRDVKGGLIATSEQEVCVRLGPDGCAKKPCMCADGTII